MEQLGQHQGPEHDQSKSSTPVSRPSSHDGFSCAAEAEPKAIRLFHQDALPSWS